MLDEIGATLGKVREQGSFATKDTCGADDLRIEVKGVGRLRLPVSAAQARKLCAAGRPAPFGWRDETRRDESVRKTWEIPSSNVRIDVRRWKRTLEPQLRRIRSRLGLPEEGKLRAVFHKMLVYEPGHFFVSHQDSEKTDDMVGSLVVVLPPSTRADRSSSSTTVAGRPSCDRRRGRKSLPSSPSMPIADTR